MPCKARRLAWAHPQRSILRRTAVRMPRRRRGPLEFPRAGEAKEALGPDDRRSEEALVRFPIGGRARQVQGRFNQRNLKGSIDLRSILP
jgi:hypothetical protein